MASFALKIVEKPKPKPKPEIKVAEKPKPKVQPKPEEVKAAREKAKQSGVLAMSSQLSKLSELADTVKLDTPKTFTAKTPCESRFHRGQHSER